MSVDVVKQEVRVALEDLRKAVAGVLEEAVGPRCRPRDLVRTFDLHQTLAWKITRVAHGGDPYEDARFVPGESGFERFLSVVTGRAAGDTIERVREARTRFEQTMLAHAGDRESRDVILRGLASEQQPDPTSYRRAGYRCNSFVWGVQTRVRLQAHVVHRATDSGRIDIAQVRGFVDVRRLRTTSPLVLARRVLVGEGTSSVGMEPIDGLHNEVPLLRPFCSDPLPKIVRERGPGGEELLQFDEGVAIGARSAVTCFTGEVWRGGASLYATGDDRWARHGVRIRAPIKLLVHDLVIERGLFGAGLSPELIVASELSDIPWYRQPPDRLAQLEVPERVVRLPEGIASASLTEVPRYGEVLAFTCDKLGWNPADFDVFRVRMEYPVIPTAVVMRFPLLDPR